MLLTPLISVLLAFIPLTSLNFSIPHSPPNCDRNIICEGSAFTLPDNVILLNDVDKHNDTGRITYVSPMHLWDKASGNLASFTTNFSFIIKSIYDEIKLGNHSSYPYQDIGDGLTFFLASNISQHPLSTHLNAGGGLGIGRNTGQTTTEYFQFVAIEFDTYQNAWDLENGAHVGVDVNSMVSAERVKWNLNLNEEQRASVSYDGATKTLSVLFDNSTDGIGKLDYEIDLSKHLPDYVTVGFSASTGILVEMNSICSWDFSSDVDSSWNKENQSVDIRNQNPHHLNKKVLVGLVVGGCIVIGCLLALLGIIKNRKERKKKNTNSYVVNSILFDEIGNGVGPRKFSYKELSRATTNFAEIKKLGEGGFGGVYCGFLKELKFHVAIKRVSGASNQGIKEYASEVKIISKLRHKNLVQLIGWCHEKNDLILVYELMPNGSLDRFLFSKTDLLTWELRYKIAVGLASALLYLHEEWEQCVLHRDIKSSNVMLDQAFNAKLGDFGLARLVDHEKGTQTTTLGGTMGYIAPESVWTGKASKETDIYSFGIVALEIACGRKPIEPKANPNRILLLEWVWELYGSGEILEASDPKLCSLFDEQEMRRLMIIGLWCAHPDHTLRPSIRQVIRALNIEASLPILPSKLPVATYSSTSASDFSLPTSSFSFSNGGTSSSSCSPFS